MSCCKECFCDLCEDNEKEYEIVNKYTNKRLEICQKCYDWLFKTKEGEN